MKQYLAGIFDAEGYVRIRKNLNKGYGYSYTYEVRVYMCDLDIITLFSKQYDLKISSSNRGIDRKIAYYICLNGKQLRETSFIDDILPYLNEKRLQLQEIKNLILGIKDREDCYQDYMKAKESFSHPIVGKLSYEYIAGVLDGDGWFTMFNASKDKTRFSAINKFAFGLEQRYKPMIDYMLLFGGSVNQRPLLSDKHTQTWEWRINDKTMLPLLINIYPYLVEKEDQCGKMIDYIQKYEEFKNYSQIMLSQW